jgi:hypothetical protein
MDENMQSKVVGNKINLDQLKKDKLYKYVPFIKQMMAKVAGSELESQWIKMHERVVLDEKT